MICNISRLRGMFNDCRVKEYNLNTLGLWPLKEAEPLVTGAATHLGFAEILANKSSVEAEKNAQEYLRAKIKGEILLDEERELYSKRELFVRAAVRRYKEKLPAEGYQVLMPEVTFRVAMPGTEHHCYYIHQLFCKTDPLFADFVKDRYNPLTNDGCLNQACYQPIYFKGRTDAVVRWSGMVWLLEHKTSSDNKEELYWKKWPLDFQTTGYIYGIWKATGVRPAGVILNKIYKPNKRQNPEDVKIDREPFLKSDDDLARFEKEFILQAQEYENIVATQRVFMNSDSCVKWSRVCMYHKRCIDHGVSSVVDFKKKPMDYVEEEYYKLLQIPLPEGVAKMEVEAEIEGD